MESGLTRRTRRYIGPGDLCYSSRVVGAVEIQRIFEPEIGPHLLVGEVYRPGRSSL